MEWADVVDTAVTDMGVGVAYILAGLVFSEKVFELVRLQPQ